MSTLTPTSHLTPADVERASERDAKNYELIEGELREKPVGTRSLFIAHLICEKFNSTFYPEVGFAVVETMVYCFARSDHGRKPDVTFVRFARLPRAEVPEGDIHIVPDLVVEVLSPGNGGIEIDDKLDEYLGAGVPLVWIVNPTSRTIRVYRSNGTTQLFRGQDVIESEPLLPGFRLAVADAFPAAPKAP